MGKAKSKRAGRQTAALRVDSTSKPREILAHLEAKLPPLDPRDRAAFDALFTDEQRSDLGKQTKASAVLECGAAWALAIDAEKAAYPEALKEYSEARLAYLVAKLRELDERIEAQRKKQSKVSGARASADELRREAFVAREDLLLKMKRFAGRRPEQAAALAQATGTSDGDALGASIAALAELATSWLTKPGDTDARLAKHAGLTQALVDEVAAKGVAASRGSGAAAIAGKKEAADAPQVNVAEGAVLFEMLDAYAVFNAVADRAGVVRRLVPTTSVRHVFVKPKGKPKTTPGPATTPAAP